MSFMDRIISDMSNLPLILCGAFYAVLCVFSIVTGIIYMSGKRELNPVELSEKTVSALSGKDRRKRFARVMGLVTFFVGIAQGVTAFAVFKGGHPVWYFIALGFTVFSIISVSFKLKGRVSAFALVKLACYLVILVILLLDSTRALFFM